MPAALPLIAFVSGFLALGNSYREWGWGKTFVRSLILMGAYLTLGTESLSLVRWITPLGLSLMWLAPSAAAIGLLVHRMRGGEELRWPPVRLPRDWADWVLVGVLVLVAVLTGVVGFLAPQSIWDSLTYHMARVAHWAQNESLAHYATGIPRQNFMSPGAELSFLHAYVLAGGDRLANLVQWAAMLASLVSVAVVSRQLGLGRTGQLFAGVLVATLPMGISQASSTMTDYVVALWLICVASETLRLAAGETAGRSPIYVGLAAGLAVLTKPTAFAFLLPFAVWVGVMLLRRAGVRRTVLTTAGVALILLVVNAGYIGRNLLTYGSPLGDPRKVAGHSNAAFSLGVVFSNTVRNASLHVGTPWAQVNHQIWRLIVGTHFKLSLDVNDPRTSLETSSFQILVPTPEGIRAGNPLQALLIVIAFLILIAAAVRRRARDRRLWSYAMVVALSFIAFSAVFRVSVFGSRYQMPFFVLAAPVVAAALLPLMPRGLVAVVAVGLLAGARPWLLELEQRSILPDRDGRSLLTTDRDELYLPEGMVYPFQEITAAIEKASCDSVGVMLGGDAAEYPLWPYLGAPRKDLTIEWIVAGTPSERYRRADFEPCAVVCDGSCPAEWASVRGLPLRLDVSGFRLFLASEEAGPASVSASVRIPVSP
jgi:hypothetical protein